MTALGVDFAWAKPDPAAVKAAGYSFVIGYVSRDPTKDLTRDQAIAYQAAGLGVLLVWEWTANRALAGLDAGVADAKEAVGKAQARGYPDDVPLFFADDTNTSADQVRPYFQGVASVRPCVGVYGGIHVTDPLLADGTVPWAWQACAWSTDAHGVALVSQTAHLYQRLHPTTHLQGSFDEDVLLKPVPMWTAQTPAPPGPVPQPVQPAQPTQGARMWPYIIRVTDGPLANAEFFNYGDGAVHIDGPESAELVAAPNPIPVKSLSGALFAKRFPEVTA